MKRHFRTNAPDIGIQILHISKKFPRFKYKGRGVWIGSLEPRSNSRDYKVKIIERHGKRPLVYIIEPKIKQGTPHVYPDNSLCLYYPKDFSWRKDTIIAKTIIPWTALWLFFYEIWLECGVWYGESVDHKPKIID